MNYIFFGTPQFAVIILKTLIEADYTPALVVVAPDKPKGRGQKRTSPPVKIFAEKHNIPVMQPPRLNDQSLRERIVAVAPDLFIVAAYGKIIPKAILDIPPKGGMNVHPSLLPKYRGPSPIQETILHGDETTGVTIMLMDEEMDHGPILAQRELTLNMISNIQCFASTTTDLCNQRVSKKHNNGFHTTLNVGNCPTAEELSEKLAHLGAQLLVKTIPKWLAGDITSQEQDHAKATYTKIIIKEDGRIDWRKSAEEIERMVRAYTPWPSAWTIMCDTKGSTKKEVRVKILKATVSIFSCHGSPRWSFCEAGRNCVALCTPLCNEASHKSGTLLKQKSDLLVACGSGFLMVKELQVEGKKPMSGREFVRGYGANQSLIFGLK